MCRRNALLVWRPEEGQGGPPTGGVIAPGNRGRLGGRLCRLFVSGDPTPLRTTPDCGGTEVLRRSSKEHGAKTKADGEYHAGRLYKNRPAFICCCKSVLCSVCAAPQEPVRFRPAAPTANGVELAGYKLGDALCLRSQESPKPPFIYCCSSIGRAVVKKVAALRLEENP